jgi:hypothetical protein
MTEMCGLGDMRVKKEFLIGCIPKRLEPLDMETRKLSSYLRKYSFLKIMESKFKVYLLASIIATL